MEKTGLNASKHTPISANIPAWSDLLWSMLGGLMIIGMVLLGEFIPESAGFLAPLRIPLGLAYVLFVPGYLLVVTFFPRKDELDHIERVGLSLGLSVALVPLLALLLDWLPWGLRLLPITFGQVLLVEVLVLAALVRRFTLPVSEAYTPDLRFQPRSWWGNLDKPDRRLVVFITAALVIAVGAAAWIFLVPSNSEFMTEFYILGPEGSAESYPRQAVVNETLSVTIGFSNLERDAHTYRVEVWVVNPWEDAQPVKTGELAPMTLAVDQTQETTVNWSMPSVGDDQRVDFNLYKDDQATPYRQLRLWLNVKAKDE